METNVDSETWGRLLAGAMVVAPVVSALYWMVICEYVAREKDRRKNAWAMLGFLGGLLIVGGPLVFLPLAVVPDLTEYESP